MMPTVGVSVPKVREHLGRVGVFSSQLLRCPVADEPAAARRIEELGYGSVWSGELVGGKEAFGHTSVILSATTSLMYGTGIANIWARHPATMQGGAATVSDAWPGRFALGIGVSHARIVDGSKQTYERPLTRMRRYLDEMDAARDDLATATPPAPRLLAALGPKMLELAREHADGAVPYFVPPEHVALAREILGPDKLLIVEQAAVLETDREAARRTARGHTAVYLQRYPNYVANLQRMGYRDEDVAGAGSDRLVDDLVVWGGPDAVARRVDALLSAGADSVLIQMISRNLAHELDQLGVFASSVALRTAA